MSNAVVPAEGWNCLVLLSTKITKTLNVPHLSITAVDGLEIPFHVNAVVYRLDLCSVQ